MIIPVLVFQGHNTLRYLVTAGDGGAWSLTSAQFRADAIGGPLSVIANAHVNGIGPLSPGTVLTQAQARDILLADGSGASVGTSRVPRARARMALRQPGSENEEIACCIALDADVDADGNPILVGLSPAGSVAYLDIDFIGGIGTV